MSQTTRACTKQDIYIGERIREARIEAEMSQSDLGGQLGVSFQQVQKYEKGANRVGGSRFMQVAKALNKPIEFFFQNGGALSRGALDPVVSKFLASKDGHVMATKFPHLPAAERAMVLSLVLRLFKGRN